MRPTKAKPGKPIVMKLREDEEELVIDWLNSQDIYSDSIRYLIQKEIAENGIRNLQLYIPRARTVETFKAQLDMQQRGSIPTTAYNTSHLTVPSSQSNVELQQRDQEVIQFKDESLPSKNDLSETPAVEKPVKSILEEPVSPIPENQKRRPAAKSFNPDVISSYT